MISIKRILFRYVKKQEQKNFKKMTGCDNKEELINSCIKGTTAYEIRKLSKALHKLGEAIAIEMPFKNLRCKLFGHKTTYKKDGLTFSYTRATKNGNALKCERCGRWIKQKQLIMDI